MSDSTGGTFTSWATEEESIKGRPFPPQLSYHEFPPVHRLIVNNRITPLYYLGWTFPSIAEFCSTFDPDDSYGGWITDIFGNCSLQDEWEMKCSKHWKTPWPEFKLMRDDSMLIYISTNFNKSTMEKMKDQRFIEAARSVLRREGDPVWFRR